MHWQSKPHSTHVRHAQWDPSLLSGTGILEVCFHHYGAWSREDDSHDGWSAKSGTPCEWSVFRPSSSQLNAGKLIVRLQVGGVLMSRRILISLFS